MHQSYNKNTLNEEFIIVLYCSVNKIIVMKQGTQVDNMSKIYKHRKINIDADNHYLQTIFFLKNLSFFNTNF